MVTIRKAQPQDFSFEEWAGSLQLSDEGLEKLTQWHHTQDAHSESGMDILDILQDLHMDDETMLAAYVLPYCQQENWSAEQIEQFFGSVTENLLSGVQRMDAIKALQAGGRGSDSQIDNIRRMLLSMVEDVRAVVIKLAERVCCLRQAKHADEETRVMVAKECGSIYAPLANRLGIGQLKWELEDLSFRYLHPETYKNIARLLDEKRTSREMYIDEFVSGLDQALNTQGVRAEVYGRPKHIFSIWKKMQKKQLTFEQLFDIRAVRIIAERLQDCYGALGIVHANWKHIPREFDDYIATPKPNGYQSIHTVAVGPQGRSIEIQIRTQQMHQDAELGVAAHWKYKEGANAGRSGYEERINWLRKVLQWQEEIAESGDLVEELRSQVFDDRVYVFTPRGDVIDLPLGSTPLDFAYYIHSNVGHSCVGSKVGGRIVPLTYQLQTGDQIDILRSNKHSPSRDWMNPSLGYIHSSRARAKIHTWFKKQDRDKNLVAGKELLESEMQRLHLSVKDAGQACERFNMNNLDDLYTAIGGGDVRINQVLNFLQQQKAPPPQMDPRVKQKSAAPKTGKDNITIEGVGNLMSQIAGCCRPVPGERIQGYITLGRGVSVHRHDCEQLERLIEEQPERHIDVSWASAPTGTFEANVQIHAGDRNGVVRDITTVLANERISLLGLLTKVNQKEQTARVDLKLEVKNLESLAKTMSNLQRIQGVIQVKRIEH